MEDELVSVSQVASELGKQKQHIFKVLKRLGIDSKLERRSAARGQKVAYITTEDHQRVREYFSGIDNGDSGVVINSEAGGVFYLIQFGPEQDPGRSKIGFATNIEERLRSHRTVAPFSKVLRTWPCRLGLEKTAIECATQDCERLHTEVFCSMSIEEVQSRCDQFFRIMPQI